MTIFVFTMLVLFYSKKTHQILQNMSIRLLLKNVNFMWTGECDVHVIS
jgi:hypothetical protein